MNSEKQKCNVYSLDFDIKTQLIHLFSFKDVKTGKFLPPFFANSDDEAKRQCSSIVNFSNSLICKFPEDYQLYFIGTFAEDTGIIVSVTPEIVCDCSSLKTEKSLSYDELLKEVKQLNDTALSYLSEFHTARDKHYRNESEYRKEFEQFLNTSKEELQKAIELYIPVSPKVSADEKKSIITKLFKK